MKERNFSWVTVVVAIRPVLGSLMFREVLTFGGQIRKYLLDLGDPCLEKLKRSVKSESILDRGL